MYSIIPFQNSATKHTAAKNEQPKNMNTACCKKMCRIYVVPKYWAVKGNNINAARF